MQRNDQPGWEPLAAAMKAARMSLGYRSRAPFAKKLGIDDSTLAIIEGGRKGPVSESMLDFVTSHFQWPAGAWRDYLTHGWAATDNGSLTTASDTALLAELLRRATLREAVS